MIPIILLFLLPSTITQYRSLAEATPLLALATAVDSTHPPIVPEKQYWGTFYYPWYGDGELPELTFAKDLSTSPLLGYTEPEVIRVNRTFYLYYRTDSSIAVAKSTNGQNWNDLTTVLAPSPTGWDSGEVISPSLIIDQGTYYLFYEADDASRPGNRAVGLATSTNPTGPFTKHPNNPILTPSQPWEGNIVGTPAITKIGATYYLFYHGFSDGKDRGGVAYSNNLLSWTKEANNPILDTGPASSWDSEKVAPSDVYSSATSLWVFYEGYNGTSWRIGLATGTQDPTDRRVKTLTKQPASILDLGSPGSFDSHTLQLPTIVLVGPQLWLYYSGNDGQAFRLGRATAPTPDTYRHWRESKPNSQYHNPPATWASMSLPDDNSGAFDPASQLYSSKSTIVIDRHLAWMNYARLDFALISWWGKNSYEDEAFRMMLDRAELSGSSLKLGIYYELQDNTTAEIVDNLRYILNNYGVSPAFFKITIGTLAVPVIFVYMVGTVDGFMMTDRWRDARAQLYSEGTPVFISLKVFENYTSGGNDLRVDGWHQYAPCELDTGDGLQGYELQQGYSAFASPGYWEYPELGRHRNQTRPQGDCAYLPRDSVRFTEAVKRLAKLSPSEAKFLLIETFNEFHEGSQIEPAFPIDHIETGFAQAGESYRTEFLDVVRYRGQSADFSISTNPASLNITQGSSGTSSIVLRSLNGFKGLVILDATVSPIGPTLTLTPASIELTADGQATATLEITSPSSGAFTVTIIGASSSLSRSLVLEVTVTSPPPSETPSIPDSPGIYLLAAMPLVIVAITVALFLRRKRFSVSS